MAIYFPEWLFLKIFFMLIKFVKLYRHIADNIMRQLRKTIAYFLKNKFIFTINFQQI